MRLTSVQRRLIFESAETDWATHVAFYLMLKNGPQPKLTLMKYAQNHGFEPQIFLQKIREFRPEVEQAISDGKLDLSTVAASLGVILPGTKKPKPQRTRPRQEKSQRSGSPREQIFAILQNIGAELLSQKNHYKYRLPNGGVFVFPKTPSDSHSEINALSQLRRMLAEELTSPQRFLLFEAGMSRRGFLKLVGKAAGAAMGAPVEKAAGLMGKLGKMAPNTFVLSFNPHSVQTSASSFTEWLGGVNQTHQILKSFSESPFYSSDDPSDSDISLEGFMTKDRTNQFLDWARSHGAEVVDLKAKLDALAAKKGQDFIPKVIQDSVKHGSWKITLPNGNVLNLGATLDWVPRQDNSKGSWELVRRLKPFQSTEQVLDPQAYVINGVSDQINHMADWLRGWPKGHPDEIEIVMDNISRISHEFGDLPSAEELQKLGIEAPELEKGVNRLRDVEKEAVARKELNQEPREEPRLYKSKSDKFGGEKSHFDPPKYDSNEFTSVQRRVFEDFHGGDYESGGQFPTSSLERSQARKGPGDLFVHSDPGQAGKSKFKKKKIRKKSHRSI